MNTLTNSKFSIYVIIAAITALVIALVNNSYKELDVNLYITNTYIYIMIGILLTSLTVLLIDALNMNIYTNIATMIGLFLIVIVIIILLNSSISMISKNLLFVILCAVMGYFMFPTYKYSLTNGIFLKSLASVLFIFIGLTFITSMYPDDYFDGWGAPLVASLGSLIIFELLDMIFYENDMIDSGRYKLYAMAGIAIFCGFIVYDTKRIKKDANIALKCVENGGSSFECSNYSNNSLGLYLDLLNLFNNINQLQR